MAILLTALACAAALMAAGCTSTSSSMGSASSGSMGSSDMMSGTSTTDTGGYTTISAEEAKKMIDAGGVTIVDVRTQSEYESAHIPGAVLVPMDTIGDTQPSALPDKDATLLVYCRTGIRSAQASASLAKLGYAHVYNMDGGITAWTYGTETGNGS